MIYECKAQETNKLGPIQWREAENMVAKKLGANKLF